MNHIQIESFNIIGIAIRTTNEHGQSGIDIPALWNTFMKESSAEKIPGKIDTTVYCVYTDYEKDYIKPYTTILGCKVSDVKNIPAGMVGKTIEAAQYINTPLKEI